MAQPTEMHCVDCISYK